jgi:hypothetical protein
VPSHVNMRAGPIDVICVLHWAKPTMGLLEVGWHVWTLQG